MSIKIDEDSLNFGTPMAVDDPTLSDTAAEAASGTLVPEVMYFFYCGLTTNAAFATKLLCFSHYN